MISTRLTVKPNMVFAAVWIGQKDVAVIVEEGYRDTLLPRLEIDLVNLAAHRFVSLLDGLAVWQLYEFYILVCTHGSASLLLYIVQKYAFLSRNVLLLEVFTHYLIFGLHICC